MRQIILYGTGNSGKSTSLRILFEKYFEKNKDFISLSGDVKTYKTDYLLLAEYKGKKIGIYTWGDNEKSVREALKYTKDCDIAIITSRSKGAGYRLLSALTTPQIWIKKSRVINSNKAISEHDHTAIIQGMNENTADQISRVLGLLI